MSGYKRIMQFDCPNNWNDCNECLHERDCIAGLYHGEEDVLIKAAEIGEIAEIAERTVMAEARESAEKIKSTWQEEFLRQPSDQIWAWMARYRTSGLHAKEPYKAMSGPTAPGGGSKSNVKNSNKGNKPTIYVWEPT